MILLHDQLQTPALYTPNRAHELPAGDQTLEISNIEG